MKNIIPVTLLWTCQVENCEQKLHGRDRKFAAVKLLLVKDLVQIEKAGQKARP